MVAAGAQPGCRPKSPQPWFVDSTTTALTPAASGPGPPSPPRAGVGAGTGARPRLASMVLAGNRNRKASSAATGTIMATTAGQPSTSQACQAHVHVIAQSWPPGSSQQTSKTSISTTGTGTNTTSYSTSTSTSKSKSKAKPSSRHIHSPSSSSISTSTATTFSTSNSTSTWVSSPSASSITSKSTSVHSPSSSVTSSPSRSGSSFSVPVLNRTPLPVLSVIPPPGEDNDNNGGSGLNLKREARRPVMQRVSAFLPSWDKRNSNASSNSRPGLFGWSSNRSSTNASNALAKLNTHAANGRVQREAFWPATLDRECEKAARILKSFSTDGYLAPLEDEDQPPANIDPKTPIRISKKIPRRIIQNAAGIAIFTCMRSGLWMTGSGGSGILIARKSDGTWSLPSGIMLHTPTLSFIIGVDIYDCVLVVNNLAALESITKPRVTLGEDVGLIGGPLVSLDSDEAHIKWQDLGNTVFTYMKARGQTQVVNLNGCILTERGNENERFYDSAVSQMDILAGNVARHVEETKPLFEVIKMAEGRTDYEAAVIRKMEAEVAPGDAMIATPKSSTPASPRAPGAFGIPNADDPDPFGVLALEMAGLEIREAGSKLRPASSQFDFNPVPSSPAFSKFNRQSIDTYATRSNRGSYMSQRTVKSTMTDAGTQTDVGTTPETTPSPGQSDDGHRASSVQMPNVTEEDEEIDYTKVDLTPLRHLSGTHSTVSVISHSSTAPVVDQDRLQVDQSTSRDDADRASSNYDMEDDDKSSTRDADDEDDVADEEDVDDEDDDEEEPVVFEVAAVQPARIQAVASRVVHAKGNMVVIPKRIPPPLPMRSPARVSRSSKSDIGDVSNLKSPLRQTHNESDLHSDDDAQEKTGNGYLTPPRDVMKDVATETRDEDEVSDESDVEFFMAEEAKIDQIKPRRESQIDDAKSEDLKDEVSSEEKGIPPSSSQNSLTVPEADHVGDRDSVSKKHTSSIYTGTTEERWSFDGSSLTTPTSDRPYSVVDDIIDDETPRKPAREAEKHEIQEKDDEVEKMGSKEPTPATITVA